jgi:anti-sigma factor RsiW
VIELARSCERHRPLLVDFVDHGEVRAGTSAALAHLDRCDRCTDAMESTIVTITALRRLGASAIAAEPAPDAWPRLRARLERRRARRPKVMSPLAGIAMSFAIVAVLIVPFRLDGGSLLGPAASPTIDLETPIDPTERRIETAYIAAVRHTEMSTKGQVAQTTSAFIRIYPDDIRPARKEVGPAAAVIRPSAAS